jgi:2-dehydropantoate 2-reductase
MRLVVVGAGAIGGSVGGRLALAGRDVVLVARGAHGAAIRARGVVLEAPDGIAVARPPVVGSIGEIAWRAGDVVVLAVKTQDVAAAADELAARCPPDTPVACLTNGLEAERVVARWFADVHAACVWSPATYLVAGTIQQWSHPVRGVIDVGRFPDGTTRFDGELAAALRDAGFASEPRADILRWKRAKLLLNLGGALDALCGNAARSSPLAAAARAEADAVLAAASLPRASDAEHDARPALLSGRPIAGATRSGTSTWQSLARGRPLETDYLNGEIVLLGRLHGVATPVNERIQRAAARAARDRIAPGSLSIEEL